MKIEKDKLSRKMLFSFKKIEAWLKENSKIWKKLSDNLRLSTRRRLKREKKALMLDFTYFLIYYKPTINTFDKLFEIMKDKLTIKT